MKINHVVTLDDPFGLPWPPAESGHWHVVRRAHGFTAWRQISIATDGENGMAEVGDYQTRRERRIERRRQLKLRCKMLAAKQQQIDFLQSRMNWKSDEWIMREIRRIEQEIQNISTAAAAVRYAQ